MTKKLNKLFIILAGAFIIGALTFAGIKLVKAETSGGSPDSGVASYIKTIYTSLVAKTQGSDAAGSWGDWGAYWNRIRSTTALLPASMVNQAWNDDHGAPVTETTNYSLTWTANPTPVTGDDARAGRGGLDPRTGLTWSQLLLNNAGTVAFSPTTNSTWNWDGTLKFAVTAATAAVGDTYTNNGQTFTVGYAIAGVTTLYAKPASSGLPAASGNLVRTSGSGTDPIVFSSYTLYGSNVAVGGKSAKELCSDRGSGWRLPTQKELMQAYIDGSYWNLTQPSYYFWSATETSSTIAWNVLLSTGFTNTNNKSNFYNVQIRCIR